MVRPNNGNPTSSLEGVEPVIANDGTTASGPSLSRSISQHESHSPSRHSEALFQSDHPEESSEGRPTFRLLMSTEVQPGMSIFEKIKFLSIVSYSKLCF